MIDAERQYEKTFAEIMKLSPFDLVFRILDNYDCSNYDCAGMCCKSLDIPFSESEILNIGKNSRKNRRILDKLEYPGGKAGKWTTVSGKEVSGLKVFPFRPCPFLDDGIGKCIIQKRKPIACRTFPFDISLKNRSSNDSDLYFKLALCEMGFDIYLDYIPFLYMGIYDNEEAPLDKPMRDELGKNLAESEAYMAGMIGVDKKIFENVHTITIQNISLMRLFLMWLTVYKNDIAKYREILYRSLLTQHEQKGN